MLDYSLDNNACLTTLASSGYLFYNTMISLGNGPFEYIGVCKMLGQNGLTHSGLNDVVQQLFLGGDGKDCPLICWLYTHVPYMRFRYVQMYRFTTSTSTGL